MITRLLYSNLFSTEITILGKEKVVFYKIFIEFKGMLLTTKGRYAVMAMVDVAVNATTSPVSLADVSKRQDIDLGYLEQIFAKLKTSSLVISKKGPGGGYMVAKSFEEITLSDIMKASEESTKMTRCENKVGSGCIKDSVKCSTHHLWDAFENHIDNFLSSITLADVINKKFKKIKCGGEL